MQNLSENDYLLIRDTYGQLASVLPLLAARFEPISELSVEQMDAMIDKAISDRENEAPSTQTLPSRRPAGFEDDMAFNPVTRESIVGQSLP